jgi:hypothetical protein
VSDISIELKLLQPRVLVQESLVATTTLVNHGSAVVAAPAAYGPSPFVYELRPARENQTVRVVSSQGAREATSRGTPQQRRPLPFNLGPGRSLPREEDLAALAVRPFAPAMYTVTVSCRYPGRNRSLGSQPRAGDAPAPSSGVLGTGAHLRSEGRIRQRRG